MAKLSRPRKGSLQFWPRKRASKFIPSVNWSAIHSSEQGLLGFIAYKAGMSSAIVKDNTQHSMIKGKKRVIPSTILEVPPMKLFSIRFYKNNLLINEMIVSNDKELKRKLKVPSQLKDINSLSTIDYDDVRAIVYSLPNKISLKKTPDLAEVAVGASSKEEKLNYLKSLIGKEIPLSQLMQKSKLLDARSLSKGKGLVGPVKRFGITLKSHKSEKGVRRPGSLGPWHPAYVMFRTPMAGQLGMFSRIQYNVKIITRGASNDKKVNPSSGFKHYGNVTGEYLVLAGSIAGPQKRQILLTSPLRATKHQLKKEYEFLELAQ